MNDPSRRTSWSIGAGLLLMLTLVGLALVLTKLRSAPKPLPVYAQIGNFTLTNQFSRPVTLDHLTGQVWVVDVIFTRCPGPCARMSRQMSELQTDLRDVKGAQLVSLTTDPEFDQPEVLKRYGERFSAAPGRWQFLTGTKAELARLAVEGLKFVAVEKKPEERDDAMDLFIHSTTFALVDKHGRLRAMFETQPISPDESEGGTPDQWRQTKAKILAGIRGLLAEE